MRRRKESDVQFLPIAPAEESILGLSWGMAFVDLLAPSLSAAEVVLSIMLFEPEGKVDLGVDWFSVPMPSCSIRGPVDLGIFLVFGRGCLGACCGWFWFSRCWVWVWVWTVDVECTFWELKSIIYI